jgi:hypothetical protein
MSYFWPLPPVTSMTFDDKFYDQIFTSSFLETSLELLRVPKTYENYLSFREGHHSAFQDYMSATYARENFASLKTENAALLRVAKAASSLQLALLSLEGIGQCAPNLVKEIKLNPTHYTSSQGTKLADLLDEHRYSNKLFSIREFLSDIYISAERAQLKMPVEFSRAHLLLEAYRNGKIEVNHAFINELGAAVSNRDWNRTDDFQKDVERYNERANARKHPKDFPLTTFILAFEKTWNTFSDRKAATQGHHYPEIGQTASIFVDLVELSLRQCDAPFTRQNVVTAIRKLPKGRS